MRHKRRGGGKKNKTKRRREKLQNQAQQPRSVRVGWLQITGGADEGGKGGGRRPEKKRDFTRGEGLYSTNSMHSGRE